MKVYQRLSTTGFEKKTQVDKSETDYELFNFFYEFGRFEGIINKVTVYMADKPLKT